MNRIASFPVHIRYIMAIIKKKTDCHTHRPFITGYDAVYTGR